MEQIHKARCKRKKGPIWKSGAFLFIFVLNLSGCNVLQRYTPGITTNMTKVNKDSEITKPGALIGFWLFLWHLSGLGFQYIRTSAETETKRATLVLMFFAHFQYVM